MKWVKPSEIAGRVNAPPSKSVMIRATAAAMLCGGESTIANPSFCDDALAGLDIAGSWGAAVEREGSGTSARVRIRGLGPVDASRRKTRERLRFPCRESALCMRLFAPIAALLSEDVHLEAEGSLRTRPMGWMRDPLLRLGAFFRSAPSGMPPLGLKGPLQGGEIFMDGSLSSQFLSGLLTALPLCPRDSLLTVGRLRSGSYAALTVSVLERAGISVSVERVAGNKVLRKFRIPGGQRYQPSVQTVEGDWSGAAFLLAAAALRGRVRIDGLQPGSLQPDTGILEALDAAGAAIDADRNSVTVAAADLRGFDFDATDCPDLFPPLVALSVLCPGRTHIAGAERLRHKESDRARGLAEEFTRIGADVRIEGDRLVIEGGRIRGGVFHCRGDHRLAMAGAVAGLASEKGVRLDGWECAAKSYPGFFDDLESIGGVLS